MCPPPDAKELRALNGRVLGRRIFNFVMLGIVTGPTNNSAAVAKLYELSSDTQNTWDSLLILAEACVAIRTAKTTN